MYRRILVMSALAIAAFCTDAFSGACDQNAACFKVCAKYNSVGTPECNASCAPTIQACEKENIESAAEDDSRATQRSRAAAPSRTKQSGTECLDRGPNSGGGGGPPRGFCKDI